jgi:hypothetical protein
MVSGYNYSSFSAHFEDGVENGFCHQRYESALATDLFVVGWFR